MNTIEVKNLQKSFALVKNIKISDILNGKVDKVTILKELSFDVSQGEILGVMGKNGAGKSTLLRVLGGIYGIDTGIVRVNGDIASIFEMGAFIDVYQTGREYCKEYFYLTQTQAYDIDKITKEIEEFTELGEFFDRPIRSYSSGMMAKLLFAVATQMAADIILIDEVLVVGDEYFQGKAWKRICAMLDKGTSGIIVTHDWVSLLKLCERAIILENGKVGFEGNARAAVRYYLGMKETISEEIFILNREHFKEMVIEHHLGEAFCFDFQIQVNVIPEEKKLAAICGFESFEQGVGWNYIWGNEVIVEIEEAGVMDVHIRIPDLMLAPGRYYMYMSVAVPGAKGEKSVKRGYEELSYLLGNAPVIQVKKKKKTKAIMRRRLEWRTNCI